MWSPNWVMTMLFVVQIFLLGGGGEGGGCSPPLNYKSCWRPIYWKEGESSPPPPPHPVSRSNTVTWMNLALSRDKQATVLTLALPLNITTRSYPSPHTILQWTWQEVNRAILDIFVHKMIRGVPLTKVCTVVPADQINTTHFVRLYRPSTAAGLTRGLLQLVMIVWDIVVILARLYLIGVII